MSERFHGGRMLVATLGFGSDFYGVGTRRRRFGPVPDGSMRHALAR